jgi:DNA-directed RNA polymerase subunit RPC12/RpoP
VVSVNLLTNAVESLQMGVEDYGIGSRPRLLSAIRNIHAGVLLLYKEALRRRSEPDSNEALVKAKVGPVKGPDGTINFIGIGRRTADTQTIRERFVGLGISTEWDRFRRISEIRNDVEHYYPSASQESMKELIASAFWIVRSFLASELKEDPAETLGQTTWSRMLEVAELFEAERKACDEALSRFDWQSETLAEGVRSVRCHSCGSDLLRPREEASLLDDLVLRCTVCGFEYDADVFVPEAIAEALAHESYLVYDDGADQPHVDCPECGLSALVVSEARCARCGTEFTSESCARCGHEIPFEELESAPLCSYCSHVMSKDD